MIHVSHFITNISRSGWRRGWLVLSVLLVGGLGGFGGAWLYSQYDDDGLTTANIGGERKIVTSESRLISQIAKNVGPSVVSVNVAISSEDPFGFSEGEARAAGTGIIISSDGLIVTNRHVVPSGTTNVNVILSDGTEFKDVSVIGRTASSDPLDVAFLKINDTEGRQLRAAIIGNSSNVQVGDNVVAIGNALGQFQNSVTSGIISGFGRSVVTSDDDGATFENLTDLFQTDAAINQGNSGGPLVNLNGQVIGINTAIAGDAENIGFAIPINDVRGLIDQVLKTGKFARPYLGIRYVSLTPEVANAYDLEVSQGAFIVPSGDQLNSSVLSGGPADKAGLRERDVITAVEGKKIDQSNSLPSLLGAYQPGDKVKLTVLRGAKTLRPTVTLGELPSTE